MGNVKRLGFTVLEMMIVIAVMSVFAALTFPPLINSLRLVGRETAILNMDQAANRALNTVTASLRQAILPVKVNDFDNHEVTVSNAAILSDVREYIDDSQISTLALSRFMNNSAVGFGRWGKAWLDILERGSDFLPFTVPVPFIYDDGISSVTTLDSSMMSQLGIFTRGGDTTNSAVDYWVRPTSVVTVSGSVDTRSRLLWDMNISAAALGINDILSIHPFLGTLNPADLGLNASGPPALLDLAAARYRNVLTLPGGSDQAYCVVRFVPFRDGNGNPHIITEMDGFDLNEDGRTTDSYALGHIEIAYFPIAGNGPAHRLMASSNTVLLQLNTDSPAYQPLFSLRRQRAGGYVIDITMLMCDGLTQQSNVIAFDRTVPFIVRRYSSSVELRNMKFR
ncbi:MAG: type II secretion system GspH family protein [Planctomycetes bacterium]|nr:type II secretion system GspH family protein [Planctomycetota bacterium]